MKTLVVLTISWLLLLIPVKGLAENVYDQPYLGEFPAIYRDRFSAVAWKKNAGSNLAAVVRKSDLIVLAESENIDVAPESDHLITIYDTNVRILNTYKGTPSNQTLHLKFRAFTTGIERNAKHVFFLKVTGDSYQVLQSSYIFPRGQGYDNYMRLYGAIDCSEDVGLKVINYLTTSHAQPEMDRHLINEYLSKSMYSAVHMASATAPAYGTSVLKMAVAEKESRRFDVNLYGTAAYGLALERKQENWELILENVPVFPSYGRVPESIAFDLVANFGDDNTVGVIRDVIAKKPELAVSAAFALSKIGGKPARSVIEKWLRDPALSKREERIFDGWNQRRAPFSTLFAEALEKMNSSKREQIKPVKQN